MLPKVRMNAKKVLLMVFLTKMCRAEQQCLKLDVSTKRNFLEPSNALKRLSRKKKSDTPTIDTIEIIFLDYEISPTKYNEGKLNGADCREVMLKAKSLFHDIKCLLLSMPYSNRCL
jgi:hypothetical protein